MKPDAIWDIEAGAHVDRAKTSARALMQQGQLLERMREFQERYEFLVCAVNQVPPFDALSRGRGRSRAWRWRITSRG